MRFKLVESIRESSLYFISKDNLDGKILEPRVPDNFFTKNGYEESETGRVCFAPSIDQCLMGLSQNLTNKEFFVHIPIITKDTKIYTPTLSEVPDAKITGEIWITTPIKIKNIGKIRVIKDSGKPGRKFSYGDKEAELYDWDWEWIQVNEI